MTQDRALLAFAEFEMNLRQRELRRAGKRIKLDPLGFSLLRYLAQNSHRVVSKEELLREVWPDAAVVEGVLPTCVGRVRRALGDSGRREGLIETLHGRGYRLRHRARYVDAAPPRWADATTPSIGPILQGYEEASLRP